MVTRNTETEQKTWRVLDLINWTTGYLEEKGFDTPKSDVEWMLGEVLGCSRIDLYTDFAKPLTPGELSQFKALLKERLTHKPVQYIIGNTEFMGFPFRVTDSVLIPRPETELLVEHATDWLRGHSGEQRVLDIGTGSGCIGISIARLADGVSVDAIDNSGDALSLARENAEKNAVQGHVELIRLDILRNDPPNLPYDLIVSNPPYVAGEEVGQLQEEIREFEPREALVAEGDDPYVFFRRFAEKGKNWLTGDGRMFLEIGGTHQWETVSGIFREAGWSETAFHRDYNGQHRILETTPS